MDVFWIVQDSKYAKVLNVPWLHRIPNMHEYAWLCLNNAKICVNILDYLLIYFENVWIYLNILWIWQVLNKPKVKSIQRYVSAWTIPRSCASKCFASQLTGFYMRATLALNGLTISQKAHPRRLLDCSD